MLKRRRRFVTGWVVGCLFLLILLVSGFGTLQGASREAVQVVLLLDASGSMRETDPQGFSKLAAGLVINLLSAQDEAAIVEFAGEGKVISGFQTAAQKEELIQAINRVGREGQFTDFRAGLEASLELFSSTTSSSRRRIVVVLSDGQLDPDPGNEAYAPYSLEYRMALLGRGHEGRKAIRAQFRQKVVPVAERLIGDQIIPACRNAGIEIFSIAFGDNADEALLTRLADQTTQDSREYHFFHARRANDLAHAFLTLLQYIQNRSILFLQEGAIRGGVEQPLYIDSYVRNLTLIGITESPAQLNCRVNAIMEQPARDCHPQLQLIELEGKTPPAEWHYSYSSGAGNYSLFLLGESLIEMDLEGLAEKYQYGEPMNLFLHVRGADGRPFSETYPGQLAAVAKIVVDGRQQGEVTGIPEKGVFRFAWAARPAGSMIIDFTLTGRDVQGRELLPRPSRRNRTLVVPRFYVEPPEYSLGDLKRGESLRIDATLHNGHSESSLIQIKSIIMSCSRGLDSSRQQPAIAAHSVTMQPSATIKEQLLLTVPEKAKWGDYNGEILYSGDGEVLARQSFRLHVPSIWEKITTGLLVLSIPALITLIFFMIAWWRLKRPVGVLRPLMWPTGASVDQLKLSQVKRGFFRRHLSWRKNILLISDVSQEIRLDMLPPGMAVELIFYRFGADYIHHQPREGVAETIEVTSPDFGGEFTISLEPGKRVHLENGSTIKMGAYLFEYTNS